MRFLTTLLLSSLLLGRIITFTYADDSAPKPTPVKRTLTKIDATGSAGLILALSKNTLVLKNLLGQPATSFVAEAATLTVGPAVKVDYQTTNKVRLYQSATQTWSVTDETGEGVKISNNTLKTLAVVSQIDRAVKVRLGAQVITIPAHSLVLINNPAPHDVLDLGGNWTAYFGTYTEKLPLIVQPTLLDIQPNAEGIDNGIPVLVVGSIFDQSIPLHGEQ